MANELCFGAPSTGHSFDKQLHWMGRILQVSTNATSDLAKQKLLFRM
jgi:hypothetical protein